MLKNLKIAITVCCLFISGLQASLQVAILAQDFCPSNSLLLIAKDFEGKEKIAARIALSEGKTQYKHDEIAYEGQILLPLTQTTLTIIAQTEQDHLHLADDDSLIYLYFDVDPTDIVRVLVIKNNLLAENPYDVLKIQPALFLQEDDEDDIFGDDFGTDDLAQLRLTNIQVEQPAPLSNYDTIVLSMYVLWTMQSVYAKQAYKNLTSWLTFNHEQ